jgi:hypothetical protein
MFHLFAECPDGDWELITQSYNRAYIERLEAELNSHGIVTGTIAW